MDQQDGIAGKTIAVIGVGATGSHAAERLARQGADLVLIDRDVLEPHNLRATTLYTQDMVDACLPKAVAAADQVRDLIPDATVEAHVTDLTHRNIDLLGRVDAFIDGTDNVETRFLLNEYSVNHGVPWIHLGAVGGTGEVLPVLPGTTACYHCVFGHVDGTGLATCGTSGITTEAAAATSRLGVTLLPALLAGQVNSVLHRVTVQPQTRQSITVSPRPDCAVCQDHVFARLNGKHATRAATICGTDTYQIRPDHEKDIELHEKAEKLDEKGKVYLNEHLLRFSGTVSFTLFQDGRAIITADSSDQARSIYARFIGH